ncbi:zinc finger MYM-type protein 1-like [Rosa chinensis]|uniref:zinc finger MYM-type protein 1-like n=1 Tax=Rosa chinensis TaxID=74649 RepID=UPI000D096FBE|nr:zinc finger MYM-type protein 1-like [Rosa chinensis]
MNPQPPELIQQNRLQLKATIEAVRLLAKQALAFRGDVESAESSNRGNVVEMADSYRRMNEEVAKITLENAPRNATYTSPRIQKEILSILVNRVRRKISEEVGEAKFCLLVDEALDESRKEQMAIILRFVDSHGFVRERFFYVVSVSDTCAGTLKSKIDNVLTEYNLQVENLRGQGYDGASNMRGEWNGLQALFLQKCPYAYYVNCFAHRLQLALNAAAKDMGVVYLFFQMLTSIINVVDSSAKRVSELKSIQEVEVVEQIAAGELETGKGANQTCNLERARATRWSSRYYSIKNLMKLYNSTSSILKNMIDNGLNGKIRGEALGASKALRSFDFVFCLLLLDKTMGITNAFCKSLQEQSQEIINAMNLVSSMKGRLKKLREDGWVDFFASLISFCDAHTIDAPDFSARQMEGTGRLSQQQNCVTIEHYYRVEIFNAVIDFQLMELNSRFNEQTRELLILSSALDPRFDFQSFDIDKIFCLAEKFYPHDVPDLNDLRDQLEHFEYQFFELSEFQDLCTLSELCQEFVNTRTPLLLIKRLVRLVMTLSVSTATTERAFSAIKLIKNRLRSKMSDDFLVDLMTMHIEREIVDTIDSNLVIDEFYASGNRRAQLK